MARFNYRKLEVVAGTIALVAGLIYMFVGVPGFAESGSGVVHPGQMYILGVHYTYSLESQVTITIHWSSSGPEDVFLYACGQDSSCSHPQSTPIQQGAGSSGSFNLSTVKGDYFAVESTGDTSLSYSGATPFPFFWIAIVPILVGVALLLFGLLVRPSKSEETSEEVSDADMQSLIDHLKEEGLTAAYVCASCDKVNKVSGATLLESLRTCSNCGATLDWGDLKRYLEGIVNH